MNLDFFPTIFYLINFIVLTLTTVSIIIYKYFSKKDYLIIIINIILEILFNYYLFNNNYFYMFASKLIQFIFSIHLNEILFINKKSAKLFTPYIIWNYIITLFTMILLFLRLTI